VAEVVDRLERQYRQALDRMAALPRGHEALASA